MKRASLDEMRRAVDAAAAYIDVSSDPPAQAVDLVCDHLGIVADADRRIVRKAALRKLEHQAQQAGRRRVV